MKIKPRLTSLMLFALIVNIACTTDTLLVKDLFASNQSLSMEEVIHFSKNIKCVYRSNDAVVFRGSGGSDGLDDFIIFDLNARHYYLFECSVYDADIDYKIATLSLVKVFDENQIHIGSIHTVPELAKRWSYFEVSTPDHEMSRVTYNDMNKELHSFFDDEGMLPISTLSLADGLRYLSLMSGYIR